MPDIENNYGQPTNQQLAEQIFRLATVHREERDNRLSSHVYVLALNLRNGRYDDVLTSFIGMFAEGAHHYGYPQVEDAPLFSVLEMIIDFLVSRAANFNADSYAASFLERDFSHNQRRFNMAMRYYDRFVEYFRDEIRPVVEERAVLAGGGKDLPEISESTQQELRDMLMGDDEGDLFSDVAASSDDGLDDGLDTGGFFQTSTFNWSDDDSDDGLDEDSTLQEDDGGASTAIVVPATSEPASQFSGIAGAAEDSATTAWSSLESASTVPDSFDSIRSQLTAYYASLEAPIHIDIQRVSTSFSDVLYYGEFMNYPRAIDGLIGVMAAIQGFIIEHPAIQIYTNAVSQIRLLLNNQMGAFVETNLESMQRLNGEYAFFLSRLGVEFSEGEVVDADVRIFDTMSTFTSRVSTVSFSGTDDDTTLNNIIGSLTDYGTAMAAFASASESTDAQEAFATAISNLSDAVNFYGSISLDLRSEVASYVSWAIYLTRTFIVDPNASEDTVSAFDDLFSTYTGILSGQITTTAPDLTLEITTPEGVTSLASISSMTPETLFRAVRENLGRLGIVNIQSEFAPLRISYHYLFMASSLLTGDPAFFLRYFAVAVEAALAINVQNAENRVLINLITDMRNIIINWYSTRLIDNGVYGTIVAQIEGNYLNLVSNYPSLSETASEPVENNFIATLPQLTSISAAALGARFRDMLSYLGPVDDSDEITASRVWVYQELSAVAETLSSGSEFTHNQYYGFNDVGEYLGRVDVTDGFVVFRAYVQTIVQLGLYAQTLNEEASLASQSVERGWRAIDGFLNRYMSSIQTPVLEETSPALQVSGGEVADSAIEAVSQADSSEQASDVDAAFTETFIEIDNLTSELLENLRTEGGDQSLINALVYLTTASRYLADRRYADGIERLTHVMSQIDSDVIALEGFENFWAVIYLLVMQIQVMQEEDAFPQKIIKERMRFNKATSWWEEDTESIWFPSPDVISSLNQQFNTTQDLVESQEGGGASKDDEASSSETTGEDNEGATTEAVGDSDTGFGPVGESNVLDASNDADGGDCDYCHDELRNLRL